MMYGKRFFCLLLSLALALGAVSALGEGETRDETVYVVCDASGAPARVISSVRLCNPSASAEIFDACALDGIEVVKGDAAFTETEGGVIWATGGGDVCYRGDGRADPPVSLRVSYTLDGEPVSPEALSGQSGRVSIIFDYACADAETGLVSPFLCLTGAILPDSQYTNVKVTPGAAFDDGSRTIALGLGFAGLKGDLGLDDALLNIPETVTIEADVKNFSLLTTVTLATNEPFRAARRGDALPEIDALGVVSKLTNMPEALLGTFTKLFGDYDEILQKIDALALTLPNVQTGLKAASDLTHGVSTCADALREAAWQTKAEGETAVRDAEALQKALYESAGSLLSAANLSADALAAEDRAAAFSALEASLGETPDALPLCAIRCAKEMADRADALLASVRGRADSVNAALLSAQSDFESAALALSDKVNEIYALLQGQSTAVALLGNPVGQSAKTNLIENLKTYRARLDAALACADEYAAYSGLAEGMNGCVRFIFTTSSVG